MNYTVVIPTMGRTSLNVVLQALREADGPVPREIVVVDDRPVRYPQFVLGDDVRVLRTGGQGPAAARNAGWRATTTEWIAFLDDDVVPSPEWKRRLVKDLTNLSEDVAASQARIDVPLSQDRDPTDWERGTAGLMVAKWITADMAYRRAALQAVGGFDERFPRAYREDADLALRIQEAGYQIVSGERVTKHPVRPSGFFASVKAQRGNMDDALMRHVHGRDWRAKVGAYPTRLRRHALTTVALMSALLGRRKGAAAVWAALTAYFAYERIVPGPRSASEITRMVVTSIVIPPAACAYRVRGELRVRMDASGHDRKSVGGLDGPASR
ncbi:glycosyltransferase family 2 protein [Kibdelosporangium philippinense]|uniref:glycosyltransferase family 2 protein n=1 Tax=Kibdelosporangium philippinense TaxID=211113 RepID=UPI0027DF8568|nr:glycosyltransferase [Kibdelosporangium philippinense]